MSGACKTLLVQHSVNFFQDAILHWPASTCSDLAYARILHGREPTRRASELRQAFHSCCMCPCS